MSRTASTSSQPAQPLPPRGGQDDADRGLDDGVDVEVAFRTRPPRRLHELVSRPDLDARLEVVCTADPGSPDVVLVSGPAGAGKTSWVASRVARGPLPGQRPWTTAWVTLDATDDVDTLWWAIETACSAPAGDRGDVITARGHRRPVNRRAGQRIAALIETWQRVDAPVWLVLDDAHTLTDRRALDSLTALIRWSLPRLKIFLLARHDPPVGLHRLRLEQRLLEVRNSQLALARQEIAGLLAGHGLVLGEEELDLVEERTEGWAAGVRLLAMAMALAPAADRRAALLAFTGDEHAVADYLVHEVLAGQPPHVSEVLVRSALCERIHPDLLTTLSGRDDAPDILDGFARANGLTQRVEAHEPWYRHHGLLRGYLTAELGRRPPALRARLHRSAAEWFAARPHGAVQALRHAAATDDAGLFLGLLARCGASMVLHGDSGDVLSLVQESGVDVGEDPRAAAITAAAAVDLGDPTGLGRLGDLPSLEESRCSPGPRHQETDVLTRLHHSMTALAQDHLDEAEVVLGQAASGARDLGQDHTVLRCLALRSAIAAAQENGAAMQEHALAALSFAHARAWDEAPASVLARLVAAVAAHLQCDPAEAGRQVELITGASSILREPSLQLVHTVLRGALAVEAGHDPGVVVSRLQQSWPPDGVELPPVVVAHAALEHHRMALRAGRVSSAVDLCDTVTRRLGDRGEGHHLRAALQAHAGRSRQARRELACVTRRSVPCAARRTLVEALVLDAVLADELGQGNEALRSLSAAVDVAAPLNNQRSLCSAGPRVWRMLVGDVTRFRPHEHFVRAVLRNFDGVPVPVVEGLTEREAQVLHELPSLRTVEEIAQAQFVSANTVKTQLRSIYRKLGVNTRREAVSAARTQGWL